jgi:hypothetical protein
MMESCNRVIVTFFWVLFLLCTVGCKPADDIQFSNPPDPNHVRQTDLVRQEIGLRPILPQFHFGYRRHGAMIWGDGTGRNFKYVKYDPGFKNVIWESDSYYSGRFYQSEDPDAGQVKEHMEVMYDYKTKETSFYIHTDDESKYSFPLPDPSQWDPSSKGNATLERIRLILQMWRMKRL